VHHSVNKWKGGGTEKLRTEQQRRDEFTEYPQYKLTVTDLNLEVMDFKNSYVT
jgi:hypothetical protein